MKNYFVSALLSTSAIILLAGCESPDRSQSEPVALTPIATADTGQHQLASPDARIVFALSDENGQLRYRVSFDGERSVNSIR